MALREREGDSGEPIPFDFPDLAEKPLLPSPPAVMTPRTHHSVLTITPIAHSHTHHTTRLHDMRRPNLSLPSYPTEAARAHAAHPLGTPPLHRPSRPAARAAAPTDRKQRKSVCAMRSRTPSGGVSMSRLGRDWGEHDPLLLDRACN